MRALRTFGAHITQLGDRVDLAENSPRNTLEFLAETESRNASELVEVLRMLKQRGYLDVDISVMFWAILARRRAQR